MSSTPEPGSSKTPAIELAMKVTQDRMEQYGHPAQVYAITAQFWSAYLGTAVSETDVALMMVLFKMGREINRHHDDNLVDMHGYLQVYERIRDH